MPALHLHKHHHLKEQDLQFMKEKSHLTAQFAKLVLSEKSPEMYLLSQFMRKENQSHVNNVILVTCRWFMKEKKPSNCNSLQSCFCLKSCLKCTCCLSSSGKKNIRMSTMLYLSHVVGS